MGVELQMSYSELVSAFCMLNIVFSISGNGDDGWIDIPMENFKKPSTLSIKEPTGGDYSDGAGTTTNEMTEEDINKMMSHLPNPARNMYDLLDDEKKKGIKNKLMKRYDGDVEQVIQAAINYEKVAEIIRKAEESKKEKSKLEGVLAGMTVSP